MPLLQRCCISYSCISPCCHVLHSFFFCCTVLHFCFCTSHSCTVSPLIRASSPITVALCCTLHFFITLLSCPGLLNSHVPTYNTHPYHHSLLFAASQTYSRGHPGHPPSKCLPFTFCSTIYPFTFLFIEILTCQLFLHNASSKPPPICSF